MNKHMYVTEWTNNSINQPIIHSFSKVVNQFINQIIMLVINQSTHQSVNQLINQS